MLKQDELLADALQKIEAEVSADGGVVVGFVAMVETVFLDRPDEYGYRTFVSGSPALQEGLAGRLSRRLMDEVDDRTEEPGS